MSNDEKQAPFVSIVVCTFNRLDLLKGAVQTLLDQQVDASKYELIVVDNNSGDATGEFIRHTREQHKNLVYTLEMKQGLSYARNHGLELSRGEYVAFVDDDVEVPDNYVATLVKTLSEVRPAVLGGPGLALYKSRKPKWFKDEYAQYDLIDEARPLQGIEYVFGFNMIFRRDYLVAVGGFDPALGMEGENIAYGEDIEPQILIRRMVPDGVFYYDPKLIVYHLVRPEKMTLLWNMKSSYGHGIYSYVRYYGNEPSSLSRTRMILSSTKITLGLMKDALTGLFFRDRKAFPYYQNYLLEHTFEYLKNLGRLHQKFRVSRQA